MSKALVPEANAQLRELATEIHDRYALCEQEGRTAVEYAQAALEHAQAIGEKLIAAKKLAGHGRWESWAMSNLPFSIDKAERLMRLHKNWGRIKSAPEPILGIKQAIAFLAAEKKEAKQDKPGAESGEFDAKADECQSSPTVNGVVAEPRTEMAKANTEQSACSNCGHNEFDEDDDCAKCHEPRVWPRPQSKAEPESDDEAGPVIEATFEDETDDEPQSVRDCYLDAAEADLFNPEQALGEDVVEDLDGMLGDMEQSLANMLDHDAVASLSDCDPLKVDLLRLQQAIYRAGTALERKRPVTDDASSAEDEVVVQCMNAGEETMQWAA